MRFYVTCYPIQLSNKLENWQFDETTPHMRLIICSVQTVVKCSVCDKPTHRIHSRYERKLTDLPWADYSITLQLRVRKFFCVNALCKRRIFTERLTSVTDTKGATDSAFGSTVEHHWPSSGRCSWGKTLSSIRDCCLSQHATVIGALNPAPTSCNAKHSWSR